MNKFVMVLLASSFFLAAETQAAPMTCKVSDVTIGVADAEADACSGFYSGNDKKKDAALDLLNGDLFGDFGEWTLEATDDNFNVGSDTFGNWSLIDALVDSFSGPGAIAVKAGNSFSLYFFEMVADFNSGTFNTAGVEKVGQKGNTPGLSHLTLYIGKQISVGPGPNPVPTPSTALLFISAVISASFYGRRKKTL